MLALACVLALCAVGCGRGASATPDAGDTAPPPPNASNLPRIVALSPAVAVILRDLGEERHVVGRHAFDFVLPASVPACGDQAGIDYEALLRVRPTHVFTQWGARALPEKLTTLASQQGWVVRDVNPLTLAQITRAVRTLDEALWADAFAEYQPSPRAAELIMTLTALDVASRDADAPRIGPGPVLLLAALAPPAALGPGSCHHEILLAVGGVPALREGRPFLELAAEDIVRLAPEGIVLFRPRSPGSQVAEGAAAPSDQPDRANGANGTDAFAALRGLPIPAVQQQRLEVIDDPLGLLPSTAMIAVADRLGQILRAWTPTGEPSATPTAMPTSEPGQ